MIPLKDRNPTSRAPVLTVLLIAVNVFVYFFVQPHSGSTPITLPSGAQSAISSSDKFTLEHAAIPCEIKQGRPLSEMEIISGHCVGVAPGTEVFPGKNVLLAILVSMFLHGSLLHIGGNMLFLWIFGNNIEDRLGRFWYLVFYLLGGLVAAGAHIATQPTSTVPVIGASGAIAAVMGAYLVLFPNTPILTLFFLGFFVFWRDIAAKWLLLFWLVTQFFISPGQGIAWVAHIGGFAFGVAIAFLLRGRLRPPQRHYPRPVY